MNYIGARAQQNLPYVPGEYIDRPAHLCSLIKVVAVDIKKLWVLGNP